MVRSWQEVRAEAAHYRAFARRRSALQLILARDQHRLLSRLGIATGVDAEHVKEAFRDYSSRADGPGKR